MDGSHPLQAPVGEPTNDAERNTCNLEFRSLRQAHGAKIRFSFVVPPGKKILLLQAMSRERVIDDGGRLVPKMLSRSQNAIAKFRILASCFRSRPRAQICAKSANFLKHFFAKSHVGSERSLDQFTWLWAEIEHGQRCQSILPFRREPRRWREAAFRENPSSHAGPTLPLENSGEILQPLRVDCHVIIHERQDLPTRLPNAGIQCMGLALLRLEYVAKPPGTPFAELRGDFPGPVLGVVVDH